MLSIVIVVHDRPVTLPVTLDALARLEDAEVVVVCQAPGVVREHELRDRGIPGRVLPYAGNDGFAGGCNRGASASLGERLLLLNPDVVPDPGACERLARAPGPVVGGRLRLPDGSPQAGWNPWSPLGISYSGIRDGLALTRVGCVSGAMLAVDHDWWDRLGGFRPEMFLYMEDVDICWRTHALGGEVWWDPLAVGTHHWEFDRGRSKWRYLEANRWQLLLTLYERRTLLALAPLLLAFETAVWALALRGGWWRQKAGSYTDLWRRRHRMRTQRAAHALTRTRTDAQVRAWQQWTIDSDQMPVPAYANRLLRAYGRRLDG